jgi:aerobic-type carbon monoxide dehydrogenase small subunit (CoxS/CutS family)
MIRFTVNGRPVAIDVPDAKPLLDTLREELSLTGAKECCGKGECGSCTVIMDGEPLCACLVFTAQAEGAEIITVEGIGTPGNLDPIQQAFVDGGASQCGYCIPGFVVTARALLDRHPRPTEAEIRTGLAGNICRCTGYQKIIAAVAKAAVGE